MSNVIIGIIPSGADPIILSRMQNWLVESGMDADLETTEVQPDASIVDRVRDAIKVTESKTLGLLVDRTLLAVDQFVSLETFAKSNNLSVYHIR
jgi:hypothetical protein